MESKVELKEINSTGLTDWLLEGPAWMRYRTHIDLLGQSETDPEVIDARRVMLEDPRVRSLLEELTAWPGAPLKRHNDASHLLHKLTFLADLGFKTSDSVLEPIVENILAHQSGEGAFQIMVNIPTHFGGSGEDEWQWMLCDAPLVLYALLKFGLVGDPRVQTAANHIGVWCERTGGLALQPVNWENSADQAARTIPVLMRTWFHSKLWPSPLSGMIVMFAKLVLKRF